MSDVPLYMQIYTDYVTKINTGQYQVGDKLPSENSIATEYDVSRITSRKAMELLQQNGYIERTPGRGSFVEFSHENGKDIGGIDNKMPIVGLIVPTSSDNFAMELVMGVEQGANDHAYNLMLRRSHHSTENEALAIKTLYEAGCQGLVLLPQHFDIFNAYLLQLILDGFPVVVIDRQMKGVNTSFIGSNNYMATYKVTSKMLELGHQHILYLSNPVNSATSLGERYAGFREAFIKKKKFWNEDLFLSFSMDHSTHIDTTPEVKLDYELITTFIMEHPEISCVFATEYRFAQLAIHAIRKLGLRIPEDISVVGYDGPTSETGNMFMTRILQPITDMGWQAVHILDRVIKKKESHVTNILESTLNEGNSLGPVRSHELQFRI